MFRQAGANAVEVVEVGPRNSSQHPVAAAEFGPLVSIYDRSQTIVNSIKDVQATLYIAFVLVVLVIFIFLGRATDTLIPAVALPLSLLLTFIAMQLLGYSLDNLSLMALTLAIGFLVDDAIVFLENTVRRMEDGRAPFEATLNSGQGDQLHHPVDDAFAGGGVHAAGVHERTGGSHLPRIRDHHRDLDLRQRPGFADAYAADVRRGCWQSAAKVRRKPGWSARSAASSIACWTSTAAHCGSSCGIAGSRR